MRWHTRSVLVGFLVAATVLSAAAWLSSRSTPWATLGRLWGRFSYRASAPYEGDVLLPVPFHRQEHALSCEAAALKMALAYRGIHVEERDVIDRIGFDTTPRTSKGNALVWGDPDKGFVGDIDGRMFSSGYGVHWGPVARAAQHWRRAQVIQGWDASQLATRLRRGDPVLAWGYLGSGAPYQWMTPAGKTVHAISREHVFVLNGFRGTPEEPGGFYFMDPIYGQRYLETADFMANWSVFGYRGVVLY